MWSLAHEILFSFSCASHSWPKPIPWVSHDKWLRKHLLTISRDHTSTTASFKAPNQQRKWALLDDPTALMRKLDVREVECFVWGHMAVRFGAPQSSALPTRECPQEPGTHWHQMKRGPARWRTQALRLTSPGLRGAIGNKCGASCPLSSLSAAHVLSDP